jgi:hypothetical protein
MIGKKGLLSLGCALALGLSGCGGGGGGGSSTGFRPTVIFLNASPDVASMSVKVNGSEKVAGLGYLQLSPRFQNVPEGELDIELFADGNPESYDARVLKFAPNQNTIVVGNGLKNFGNEFEKRFKINRQELDRNRPNGNARVYCLHALNFKAGEYISQVKFRTPGKNPLYTSADAAFGEIPQLGAAGTPGVDAGTYTIEVERTGTESKLVTQTVTFEPNAIYLLVAAGVVGETTGAKKAQIKLFRIDER